MTQPVTLVRRFRPDNVWLIAAVLLSNAIVLSVISLLDPLVGLAAIAAVIVLTVSALAEVGLILILVLISQVVALPGFSDTLLYAGKWGVTLSMIVILWGRQVVTGRQIRYRFENLEMVFLALILWSFVCAFTAISPSGTALHSLRLLALIIVYVLAAATIRTDQHVRQILLAFLVAVVATTAYSFLNLGQARFARIEGFFTNANAFGIFLSFTVPLLVFAFSLQKKLVWKLAFGIGIAMGVAALSLSWSRAAMLSVIVQFSVYALLQRKKKMLGVFISLLLAGAIIVVTSPRAMDYLKLITRIGGGATHRSVFWEKGLQSALQHPLMGVGYDLKTEQVLQKIDWGDFTEATMFSRQHGEFLPHNHLIFAMLTTGIPGLILTLLIYWSVFRQSWRRRSESHSPDQRRIQSLMLAMLCGALINSFFESGVIFGIGAISHYFWIALGMATAISKKKLLGELAPSATPASV
jgi:O-antigen ligase